MTGDKAPRRRSLFRVPGYLLLVLVTCHLSPVTARAASRIEQHDGLRVVYLEGSPYEIGRQHGWLLAEDVRASVGQTLGYLRRYLRVPIVRRLAANWWLDRSWRQSLPHVPAEYLDELKGLADGSGVPLRELWRMHAVPDRTYACAGFAAWGKATDGGRLIHTRNLDWNFGIGVQRHAAVFVVRPAGRRAFVNVGWAGFIGVLTGINERGVSIGQIGAETVDVSYRGVPMVFLMRAVMERSGSLEEAIALIQSARRTVGANYLIGDAALRRGAVVETTSRRAVAFEADDPRERAVVYARPMADVVLRADTAIDPEIRERQRASDGEPGKPGLEPPGGSAYEVRYLGQAEALAAEYGRITPEVARLIARTVAPESNIQSVVFAWPEAWIANADATTRAAYTTYHPVDLQELLGPADGAEP